MRAEIRVPVALDRAGSRGTGATMWLDTHRLGLRTRMRLALGEAVRFALAPPGGGTWIVGWCRIDATRAADVPDAVDLTCVITRMEPEHRSRFDAWLDELAPPPPPDPDLSASAASPNPRPGRPVAITKEALKILDESDPRSSEDTDQAGGLSVGRRAIREALRRSELGRGGGAGRADTLAALAPDPAPDADAEPGWDEPTADFTDDEPTAITPLAALIEEAARQGISAEFLASERVARMDDDEGELSGDDSSLSGDFGFELDGDALSGDLSGLNEESLSGIEVEEDPVTFDGLHSIDEEAFLAQEEPLAAPDLGDLADLGGPDLDAADTLAPAFTLDDLGDLGDLGDLADLGAPAQTDNNDAFIDGVDALGELEALESQPSLQSAPTFDAEIDLFGELGVTAAPEPDEDSPTLLNDAEPAADTSAALDDLFGGLFDDGPAQDDGFSGFGDTLGDTLSDRSVEHIQSPPPEGAGFRLSFDEAAASQGQNVGFDLQFDEPVPDSGSSEYAPPPRPPRRPKDEAPPPPSRVDDPEELLDVLGLTEPVSVAHKTPTPAAPPPAAPPTPTPPTPPPPPPDAPITRPPREEPLFTRSAEKGELQARWRAQASFARDYHDQLSQRRLDVSDVEGLPAEGAFTNLRFELPDGQVLALRGRRVGDVLELDIPRPALQKLKRLAETA
ncbi:MAG: hypothetical protein IPO67_00785 [Deltaproteobacteria bacterium]|nr:hypothetical protein [Deltaproteobacteria bacterium]